ncbi:MAG: Fur family transcriptional regulator [Acidimicrobiia bacterium]|nr:MAG: Fur family transcriptional regulator [Acidimicrobiia bacterium]
MHVTWEMLADRLRSSGLRITGPRRHVLTVLASNHQCHLTAPSITETLAGKVDPATVYRTLDTLEAVGVVTHSHLGHGPAVYHFADEPPHQHLVCSSCGVAVEVDMDVIRLSLGEMTARTGFVPDPTHFAVSGTCAACIAAGA